MPSIRTIAFSVAMAGCAGAVQADEVWESEFGDVVYERDIGTWAVWSFAPASGTGSGKIFIDGLGGVFSGRGSYGGYWMFYDSPDQPCPEARSDLEGNGSRNYGAFQVTFLDPDFPSRWSATWGACDGPATTPWNGTPRTGGEDRAASRPTIGIAVQDVTDEIGAAAGMTRAIGALVASVTPGGAAASAGVEAGDVIWRLNGTEIANARDAATRIAAIAPGAAVDLDLIRDGAVVTLRVAPEADASSAGTTDTIAAAGPFQVGDDEIGAVGPLVLMRLTPILRSVFNIDVDVSGLVVTAVVPGSAAKARGIEPGVVVAEVAGVAATDLSALRAALDAAHRAGQTDVMIRVSHQRRDATRFVALAIAGLGVRAQGLLAEAGIAFDSGGNALLAAPHLLAAVASGDDSALDALSNRSSSLTVATREVIQRLLLEAGHYRGSVDGVLGPATRRPLLDFRTSSGG